MRAFDIVVPALRRGLDRREQDEDRERTKILEIAVERLTLRLGRPVGERPEGVEGAERGRAAQIGLRQVDQPVLSRQLQQMRALPEIERAVAGVVAVARNSLERRHLPVRTLRRAAEQQRPRRQVPHDVTGLVGAQQCPEIEAALLPQRLGIDAPAAV